MSLTFSPICDTRNNIPSFSRKDQATTGSTAQSLKILTPKPSNTITMATSIQPSNLFASLDMGTNAFKLLIIHFEPTTSKFTTLHNISETNVISHDTSSSSMISPDSQLRAIEALRKFQQIIVSNHVTKTRVVATSAIREASNKVSFVNEVNEKLGLEDFQVNVLSGVEEARLTYLGVLQFWSFYDRRVLTVDIGGGSTEFVIGDHGVVVYAESLRLGHITLTQKLREGDLVGLRGFVKGQILASGLVEKVKSLGFEVAIGSSGTIQAIEKAVWAGYGCDDDEEKMGFLREGRRGKWWCFSREELRGLVERLCEENEQEMVKRGKFFGKRSEFIVAGAVLLEEIFEALGVCEMRVSGFALGEGVVAEMIADDACVGCDLYSNVRWKSVVRLAMRFNGKDRMKTSAHCAAFAKDVFDRFRKYNEVDETQGTLGFCLDDQDLEYLEAACVLHNIGLYIGKKGYHKLSYMIIMECNQLDGFALKEIELIALLARHHRKKFPKFDHTFPQGFSRKKFGTLCFIIRIAVIFLLYSSLEHRGIELYHSDDGFRLALMENHSLLPGSESVSKDIEVKLRKEAKHFKEVFGQKLLVVNHTLCSEL